MFRTPLLAATALVLCVSMASAAPKLHRPGAGIVPRHLKPWVTIRSAKGLPVTMPRAKSGNGLLVNDIPFDGSKITFNNLSKDKNAEFISWYGYRVEDSTFSSNYGSGEFFRDSEVAYNAAPFTGKGMKAKKIGAPVAAGLNLGIYSATASGLPGSELAGGSTTASDPGYCCIKWVKVDIFLNVGQKYFFAVRCPSSPCNTGWPMEDIDFTGAEVDYFHYTYNETYNFGSGTHTYHGSSPWHVSDYYPTVGAFIIK